MIIMFCVSYYYPRSCSNRIRMYIYIYIYIYEAKNREKREQSVDRLLDAIIV